MGKGSGAEVQSSRAPTVSLPRAIGALAAAVKRIFRLEQERIVT